MKFTNLLKRNLQWTLRQHWDNPVLNNIQTLLNQWFNVSLPSIIILADLARNRKKFTSFCACPFRLDFCHSRSCPVFSMILFLEQDLEIQLCPVVIGLSRSIFCFNCSFFQVLSWYLWLMAIKNAIISLNVTPVLIIWKLKNIFSK